MEDLSQEYTIVPKYKTNLTWFDRFVLVSVFAIILLCVTYMVIGLVNPQYLYLCK
jgi:hypothetical protein